MIKHPFLISRYLYQQMPITYFKNGRSAKTQKALINTLPIFLYLF